MSYINPSYLPSAPLIRKPAITYNVGLVMFERRIGQNPKVHVEARHLCSAANVFHQNFFEGAWGHGPTPRVHSSCSNFKHDEAVHQQCINWHTLDQNMRLFLIFCSAFLMFSFGEMCQKIEI